MMDMDNAGNEESFPEAPEESGSSETLKEAPSRRPEKRVLDFEEYLMEIGLRF